MGLPNEPPVGLGVRAATRRRLRDRGQCRDFGALTPWSSSPRRSPCIRKSRSKSRAPRPHPAGRSWPTSSRRLPSGGRLVDRPASATQSNGKVHTAPDGCGATLVLRGSDEPAMLAERVYFVRNGLVRVGASIRDVLEQLGSPGSALVPSLSWNALVGDLEDLRVDREALRRELRRSFTWKLSLIHI